MLTIQVGGWRIFGGDYVTDKEREVFLKTKLRNLKREYAKVIQHHDLTEHAIDLKAEIDGIERELNS